MTDDELKAIEALWQQEPKTGLPDLLVDVVPELVAEVRRLRGLVKAAEGSGTPEHWHEPFRNCPWCRYAVGDWKRNHASECPAFTEGGEVK